MELKPGYKQTEVGVIPEEWDIQTGEQITTLIGKGGSPRWQGFEYSNAGMLFVTSENVRDGFLDIRQPKYLPLTFHEKLKRTKLHNNDILVNLVGASIGRSCQIQQDIGEANINQAVAVFRVKDEHSSTFLACCFQAPTTIKRILEMQVDAARPNISLGDLRRFPIQLPPLPEQRAIAAALSDVDGLLGGLDRLIAKKRDLKQAAMQQLLTGQTRLPGFDGEWEAVMAREIGVFRGGSGFPLEAQGESNGDYPFFKVSDMNNEGNETFMTSANHMISENTRKRLGANAFPASAIVLAKVGAAIFLERKKILGQPSCIDNNMAAFVLDQSRADVRFVHTLLLSKKLGSLVATTALPALNGKQLGEMVLTLPPLPEQTAIAEVLTEMDAELAALAQRREKTRALKQAMMQELLTGRTRLQGSPADLGNGHATAQEAHA